MLAKRSQIPPIDGYHLTNHLRGLNGFFDANGRIFRTGFKLNTGQFDFANVYVLHVEISIISPTPRHVQPINAVVFTLVEADAIGTK